jgi:hypothetical protein
MLSAFYLLLIKLGQVLNTGEREKLKIGWKQSVDGLKGFKLRISNAGWGIYMLNTRLAPWIIFPERLLHNIRIIDNNKLI